MVVIFGSTTLERRKHLKQIEDNIVDASLEQNSHITGDLLDIKNKIDNNQLENGYMSQSQKESILDLYNIANSLNVSNNDQRMQQLIYNISLVKNQKIYGLYYLEMVIWQTLENLYWKWKYQHFYLILDCLVLLCILYHF